MSLIAYGKHTVENLINSPYFSLKKIWLLDKKYQKDQALLKLLKTKEIPYQILNEKEFFRHSFPQKNQGIVAIIKEFSYFSFSSLLKQKPNRKFSLLVMLDSIEDPHNFGAILRTCASLKIDGIIISQKNQVPVNNTVIKVSAGGIAYLPICQVNNLSEAIKELKKFNYQIISTICQEKGENYQKKQFNQATCLIFGNEHHGIKAKIISESDSAVFIPLANLDSLNVSVSCGIILAEVIRQWE